jgi:hypothetical protein
MAKNISFAMTTKQIKKRSKTVTRRLGWKKAKAGDVLMACVKCMGLKLGERVEKLCKIRVVSVTQEPLLAMIQDPEYGKAEAAKEGFPELDGQQFVEMFCRHMKPRAGHATVVTRIEFEYI